MHTDSLTRLIFAGVTVALVAVWLIPTIARAQGLNVRAPGDYYRSALYGGLRRTFLLHVPPQFAPGASLPMVFVLHGGGGEGKRVARLTGFSRLADREGFIVVYPDGINHHWNDGRNVQNFRAQRENVDDAGFISSLIDRFVKYLNVDSTRVYATGISNGGMMCNRLAGDRSDRFAAIAPVASAMAEDLPDSCSPGLPISVLAINGTEDPLVPWQGGGVGLLTKNGRVLSVPKTIGFWVAHDHCDPKPTVTTLPKKDSEDGMLVRREVYGHGKDGTEVVLYAVEGGGHTWPGGAERPEKFGRRSDDFNATEVIWEFFKHHKR
jgi:polyhydroxybutyrate depolymerase